MAILLLVDIDGTLVRIPAAGRAYRAALRDLFGTSAPAEGFKFGGLTDRLAFRVLADSCGFPKADVQELIRRYLDYLQVEIVQDPGYSLPGARELMRRCSQLPYFRLALGTGNVEAGARLKLSPHGLNPYFPVGGFGDVAEEREKILAAGIRRAESHYGESFDRVIVLGDTPHDIRAARAVGAHVLAVATGRTTLEELQRAGPDLILPDFSNVEKTVTAIESLAGSPRQRLGSVKDRPDAQRGQES